MMSWALGGPDFDGFWHSISGPNPQRQEGNTFCLGIGRLGERQEALPIRKYWANAPSSWSVASI